ncbi:unnamed protein product, partial [Meganyctiphanes norvegica]
AIWWKFPLAMKVVKFSFASRDGKLTVSDGATKFEFWGSNHPDCSIKACWISLYEDNTGTPFTLDNTPKEHTLNNDEAFICYGITVNEVGRRNNDPNTPVTMSNIRFYIME